MNRAAAGRSRNHCPFSLAVRFIGLSASMSGPMIGAVAYGHPDRRY